MSTYFIEMIIDSNGYESGETESSWLVNAEARVAGISGWLSRNEISIEEVLSNVSSLDGMLNANMVCDSTCIFRWFWGDQILGEVLVKDCT